LNSKRKPAVDVRRARVKEKTVVKGNLFLENSCGVQHTDD
jgi:hypothetical protein